MSSLFASDCPPLWTGGPNPVGGFYSFPEKPQRAATAVAGPRNVSQYPITTGTSVFGVKFDGGVLLGADTLGSYGSLARFPIVQRVIRVNEHTIIAASGDIADYQHLQEVIKQKQINEECSVGPDGPTMKPKALHCWLTRLMYNRRSRFNPLWLSIIVGGLQDGEPFLGFVNYLGTAYTENIIATGLGADVGVPILRDALEAKADGAPLTLDEAQEAVRKCLRVCFLRDCRATDKYHLGIVSSKETGGARVDAEHKTIDANWDIAEYVQGYE